MSVKSVIEVDVADAKFVKFKELYDKYAASLDKMPNAWGKAGDKQSEIGKGLETMTAALMAQLELSRKSDDEDEKRVKRLTTTEKLWTSIKHSAETTATAMITIGRGILGFGGLALGAAAGGIYALDRLGNAAGDARRSASGLGLSIGQQRAFSNSFSRFVDPDAFLSGISNAQSDVSKQGSLYSIGVNPNQGASDLAVDTLRHVRALALATPINQLGILESSRHLDQLGLGVEDLRRLRGTSNTEFDRQMSTYRTGVGALNIGDATAEKWQEFTQQLSKAGTQIENVFVNKLIPLAGPVGKLTDSFVHLAERFANSGQIQEGIKKFADWIDHLSGTVSKPEFLTKIDAFVDDLTTVASIFHDVFGGLVSEVKREAGLFTSAGTGIGEGVAKGMEFAKDLWGHLFGSGPDPVMQKRIQAAAQSQGSSYALAMAEWGNESSFGHDATAYDSSRSAKGIFQIKDVWAKKFGLDAMNQDQAPLLDAKINSYLDRKYHDLSKELAAYTMGETDFDRLTHGGKDKNWRSELPANVQAYVAKGERIILQINNNTGGNVTVAAQQIAPN